MIIKKDSKIVKANVERKSLALKAKKESSDEECSTFGSKDEEYTMAKRDFKKFFKKRDKNQRAFVGGSWSDSSEEDDEKVNNETCLVAQASSEVCSESSYFSDENSSIDDLVKQAHASHKAKNKVSTTRYLELLHMDLLDPSAVRSYGGNRYTLVIVDDYSRYTWTRFLKDKIEAFDQLKIFSKKIQNQLGCTIVSIRTDHGREFDNEVQFKEFCNASVITHNFSAPCTPQSNGVVERKNRTLQEMKPKNVNEALTGDSWIVAMQEELNQFIANNVWELVPQPRNMTIIGTKWVFRNKLDENVARLESIRIVLAYAYDLDFKLFQMDEKSAFLNGFINEEGACVFTDKWSLNELVYHVPTDGPYQTNPPHSDIISSIRIDRDCQVRHIRHEEEIDVQILTREIVPTLKPLEEIIWENIFCLGEQKTRKDRGTRRGRHSTSTSIFNQPYSSHLNDDDDDDGNDEGTSRASSPSHIRYVNSLTNKVPQVF
nr:retrovirus-related Pol polyprotein from transposon TNT 1-94 [Tanacetum cinerariifolium]